MSNFSAFSRFKRSILYVARRSVGVIPYGTPIYVPPAVPGGAPIYEDSAGRIYAYPGLAAWLTEDSSGRVFLDPATSSGGAAEATSGQLTVFP